jgi:hypothetical protein
MKKRLFLTAIPVLVLVCGIFFVGCPTDSDDDDGGGNGGGGGGTFSEASYGTYTGTGNAAGHTVTITQAGWAISGVEINSYGTYTLSGDSKTATLKDYGNTIVGSATISGNTLTVNLNYASGYPGIYKATKQ